jgi:hypothetical protein
MNELMAVNELLCYRILKHVYGPPDIAVALVNETKGAAVPYDWSYCLRIHEGALVEVRRISHSIFLIVWGLKGSPNQIREQAAAAFNQFVDDIRDALRRGLSLFQGKFERKRALGVGVPNPCVEKYAAALELMRLAKSVDKPRDWKRFRWGETIEHPLTGSVYLAAILFFYTALEAFEQLVRDHLLKVDRRTEEALKEIKRQPLKVRIASLNKFCDGFRQCPVPKGGSLYKKLGILSRVRNEVLHGNLPADLNIYQLSEDGFIFIYAPEEDDEAKARSKEYVPFARGRVRSKHAEYVRSLVDEIISAVIDSLMPEHVEFVCAIRRDSVLGNDPNGRILATGGSTSNT